MARLEGADAREDGLRAVAEDGDHGEAPVLDLLRLQLLQLRVCLAQVEQIEELAACGQRSRLSDGKRQVPGLRSKPGNVVFDISHLGQKSFSSV